MPPRLCADRMVMRLGRWLRLLGYDVIIPGEMPDADLIAEARQAGALILTRDRGICARRGVDALYVESDGLEEQLRQVVSAVGGPAGAGPMSRCSLCNGALREADPADVDRLEGGGDVPERILREHERFWYCPECRKFYWRGSHYDRIMKSAQELFDGPGDAGP